MREKVHPFNSQYCKGAIPSLVEQTQTTIIRSDIGTGKTQQLRDHIRQLSNLLRRPLRILCVVYRCSLAWSLKQALQDMECDPKIECYLEAPKVAGHDSLIISLDSLLKVVLPPEGDVFQVKPYDLVVLDEISSSLRHFMSETLNKKSMRAEVLSLLCLIVKNACSVIALDADVDKREIWFLTEACQRSDCVVYQNAWRTRSNFTMKLHRNNKQGVMLSVINALREGKRVVVVCNSKEHAQEMQRKIETHCPEKKGRIYTSETDEKEKRDVGECNKLWADLDWLVYSPTIGAGVDYSNEEHPFDAMFCLLVGNSTTALDVKQQTGRIRPWVIRSKIIIANLETNRAKTKLPVTEEDVIRILEHHMDMAGLPRKMEELGDDGKFRLVIPRTLMTKLYVFNTIEKNMCYNNFAEELRKVFEEAGMLFIEEDAPTTTNIAEIEATPLEKIKKLLQATIKFLEAPEDQPNAIKNTWGPMHPGLNNADIVMQLLYEQNEKIQSILRVWDALMHPTNPVVFMSIGPNSDFANSPQATAHTIMAYLRLLMGWTSIQQVIDSRDNPVLDTLEQTPLDELFQFANSAAYVATYANTKIPRHLNDPQENRKASVTLVNQLCKKGAGFFLARGAKYKKRMYSMHMTDIGILALQMEKGRHNAPEWVGDICSKLRIGSISTSQVSVEQLKEALSKLEQQDLESEEQKEVINSLPLNNAVWKKFSGKFCKPNKRARTGDLESAYKRRNVVKQ